MTLADILNRPDPNKEELKFYLDHLVSGDSSDEEMSSNFEDGIFCHLGFISSPSIKTESMHPPQGGCQNLIS